MNGEMRWVILALVAAAGVAATYYVWQQTQGEAPATAPPVPAVPPMPESKAAPAIQHPIEQAQPGEAKEPAQALPALDASDQAARDALAGLYSQRAQQELFLWTGFIRRVVATVDNLPRDKAPVRRWPVNPAKGNFVVAGSGADMAISPQNATRYLPYVLLAEAVDARKLVALYIRYYPLFQQAYRELGYPAGYFNDRLVEVIDHLLAAPEVPGPIKLVRSGVLPGFADPELESRSAGQKILIRMGPDNSARIKAKLRELRRELTGRKP